MQVRSKLGCQKVEAISLQMDISLSLYVWLSRKSILNQYLTSRLKLSWQLTAVSLLDEEIAAMYSWTMLLTSEVRLLKSHVSLKKTSKSLEAIGSALAIQGTTRHFIPLQSPHFKGLWEAAVKSFKYHLRRVFGDTHLTFEEMATLATKIEACLNSRSVCPSSSSTNDEIVLTPDFLTATSTLQILEPIPTDEVKMSTRSS